MFRTIKFKMLVLIAVCLGLGALGLGWTFQRSHEKDTVRLTQEAIRSAAAAFTDVGRMSTELMSASLDGMVRNPEVRNLLASRDFKLVLAYSEPIYREYRTRFGITHWNYWEPEAPTDMAPKGLRNIVRVGTPSVHGDFVERITLARVARERRPVIGLDLGFTGLVLRVLVPVLADQRPLGYLELGKEIGSFLQDMKRLNGDDFGLLVSKSRMDTKKWATHRAAVGQRDNWNDMPELLLVENTSGASDILHYEGRIEDIPDEGRPLEIVARGDATLARGVFPIRDVSGNKIGAVFVLHDITASYREMQATQRQVIVVMVILMAALAMVLITTFHLLVVRRLQRMIRVATRVVGGEFDLEVVPSANDELGEFETLFEQFRLLFVELIGHAQQAAGSNRRDGR